jgi:hypothetical protein
MSQTRVTAPLCVLKIEAGPEVLLSHDTERADRRERAALAAIECVRAAVLAHQLSFLAARQIQPVRKHIAGITAARVKGRTAAAPATSDVA